MKLESLSLRSLAVVASFALASLVALPSAVTAKDKNVRPETVTGCLGETSTEGAHSLVDDEGQEHLVRGGEELANHVGRRMLLEGEWKQEGAERWFSVTSFESLGACAGEESLRIQDA